MKMPKILALSLCLALTITAFAGCGNGNTSTTSINNTPNTSSTVDTSRKSTDNTDEKLSKVTIGLSSDPQDLLPWNVNLASKPYIYPEVYESLFDLQDDKYVPVLAKSWSKVDDTHYTVKIYDNIKDSAGNHITADDVVFSYNTLIKSGYALRYDIFKSIKKVDDYTVEFTWSAPVTAVDALEFPWCRTIIFSKSAYESGNFATAPVATGPYIVKNFTSGSKIVLEENPNYWQTDTSKISDRHKSNVKTIEYDIIAEAAQQVIALQTGKIDYSDIVPNENLADFTDGGQYADKYQETISASSMFYCLSVNQNSDNIFSDINMRKAVFYAIDNASCAKAVGSAIAAKSFGSPFYSDYVKKWESEDNYETKYNTDLAKQYLAKTKYNGEELTILGGNDETYKNLLTIVQSFLQNVGIKVKISTVEDTTVGNYATDEKSWDLYLYNLVGGSQVGAWNRLMNNAELNTGYSIGFIKDSKYQSLFNTAYTESTHNDTTMTTLHDYLISNAYSKALVVPISNLVYSKKIAKLYLRENQYILPGSCTYYLD